MIKFEGKDSKNPMAFHYYDPEKVVMGKKMKDWFKFSMAWWHTPCAEGGDQFGGGTKTFPWNAVACPVERAKAKMDAGFEFMQKMGIEYYCFHDMDSVDEATTTEEYEKNLREIAAYAKQKEGPNGYTHEHTVKTVQSVADLRHPAAGAPRREVRHDVAGERSKAAAGDSTAIPNDINAPERT